jgi:ATP-dependent protease ClpP protease subunit
MHELIVGGEMLLYGDVGGGADLFGDGEGFRASAVVRALSDYGNGPLTIRINSYGGEVFEGVAIYNALCQHEGEITIYIDGVAASAASLIAMAGDTVYMRPGAQMMIHNPHGGTIGDSSDHATAAAMLEKIEEQAAAIYAEATGMDADEIRSLMEAETWLPADEAVGFGFATALAEASDNNEEKEDDMPAETTMKIKRGPRMEADEEKSEEMKAKLEGEDEEDEDKEMSGHEDEDKESMEYGEEDKDEEMSAKPKAAIVARPRMKPNLSRMR